MKVIVCNNTRFTHALHYTLPMLKQIHGILQTTHLYRAQNRLTDE